MIALDTSAIMAILALEPEAEPFADAVTRRGAIIGAPTLVEARLVLERFSVDPVADLRGFLDRTGTVVLPFDAAMYEAAATAFTRYGRGRGHPARLNFGDCLSYAVARTRGLPLLFKGDDFVHTDLVPAYPQDP